MSGIQLAASRGHLQKLDLWAKFLLDVILRGETILFSRSRSLDMHALGTLDIRARTRIDRLSA